MNITNKQEVITIIKGFVRAYPLYFSVLAIILGGIFKLNILLYLILLISISSTVNSKVTKPIVFDVFKKLNMKSVSARPSGATNCSFFIDEFNPKIVSNSYGMPSGHSLESMTISVFLIMYIHKHHTAGLRKYALIIIILLIGLGVCISRVTLGCHTILQIIIGGLLGSVIGYYGFMLWDKKLEPLLK